MSLLLSAAAAAAHAATPSASLTGSPSAGASGGSGADEDASLHAGIASVVAVLVLLGLAVCAWLYRRREQQKAAERRERRRTSRSTSPPPDQSFITVVLPSVFGCPPRAIPVPPSSTAAEAVVAVLQRAAADAARNYGAPAASALCGPLAAARRGAAALSGACEAQLHVHVASDIANFDAATFRQDLAWVAGLGSHCVEVASARRGDLGTGVSVAVRLTGLPAGDALRHANLLAARAADPSDVMHAVFGPAGRCGAILSAEAAASAADRAAAEAPNLLLDGAPLDPAEVLGVAIRRSGLGRNDIPVIELRPPPPPPPAPPPGPLCPPTAARFSLSPPRRRSLPRRAEPSTPSAASRVLPWCSPRQGGQRGGLDSGDSSSSTGEPLLPPLPPPLAAPPLPGAQAAAARAAADAAATAAAALGAAPAAADEEVGRLAVAARQALAAQRALAAAEADYHAVRTRRRATTGVSQPTSSPPRRRFASVRSGPELLTATSPGGSSLAVTSASPPLL
eukprot:TRINITY_DN11362_c0_g1_i7.p1 TRINITY_DN11362_c0_g1~~TRINITY_DN11362_c0_g1_i7.p1  ORF type:complete len:510 (+),score=93.50 TRINITY_DN11362_c0_g1_i7:78-1607(+)